MKIAVPVAAFHPGNTSEYVVSALINLGHHAEILNPGEFSSAFLNDKFDFYLCVDSGEGFRFVESEVASPKTRRLAFWFIDYRHNRDRESRNPADIINAELLHRNGAWIFQAQEEDVADCKARGLSNCSWLPVAADTEIWNNQPLQENKKFDIGFVGNVWDGSRQAALQQIINAGFRLGFYGHGKAWKEEGASVLRNSKIGFNISSFYGSPLAYDLNMRFYETLSCGIPIVTNYVPALEKVMPVRQDFVKEYHNFSDIIPCLKEALNNQNFLASGSMARKWIEQNATYRHRMNEALAILTERNR